MPLAFKPSRVMWGVELVMAGTSGGVMLDDWTINIEIWVLFAATWVIAGMFYHQNKQDASDSVHADARGDDE